LEKYNRIILESFRDETIALVDLCMNALQCLSFKEIVMIRSGKEINRISQA